jgi:tRNA(His) 5'-end guanylyltransferase
MDTSDLAKRMKNYESVPKTRLMKRCPVAVRIDGRSHHSFCRGFKRPFDEVYIKSMQETAKYLCENIQGAVLSYQQSGEITLVLVDYKELNTSPFFDYEVQKLCSIIASMTTMSFNKNFEKNFFDYLGTYEYTIENASYVDSLHKALKSGAMFDTRVFNLPKEEVTNMVYWRQLDAMRNSVQMVGQANFSHRELQNKSCNDIKEMLLEKDIDWNKLPIYQQRGSCCTKETYMHESGTIRNRWIIDKNIPIFKGEGRKYIDKLAMF